MHSLVQVKKELFLPKFKITGIQFTGITGIHRNYRNSRITVCPKKFTVCRVTGRVFCASQKWYNHIYLTGLSRLKISPIVPQRTKFTLGPRAGTKWFKKLDTAPSVYILKCSVK